MADGKGTIEERVEKLETGTRSVIPPRWRDAIVVLSPIALAVMGYLFNARLEETQNEIDRTELEIRRIEAAQGIMGEIFDGEYEKALLMERLLTLLIEDPDLVAEVSATLATFYRNRIEQLSSEGQRLSGEATREILQLTAAARNFDFPARQDIDEASRLHVVIRSLARTPQARADSIADARELRETYLFPAEVWESRTDGGYYALTLGFLPIPEAHAQLERARALGIAPKDAYLTKGVHFVAPRVWPPPPAQD